VELPAERDNIDYIFEQPPAELLAALLPQYVESEVYRGMLESVAAEHEDHQRQRKSQRRRPRQRRSLRQTQPRLRLRGNWNEKGQPDNGRDDVTQVAHAASSS
jgi:hypothetical protein